MEEFGLKRKDLIRQLDIDKSSLSLILSRKVLLYKRTKTSFYYYFLTYEINRDLREEMLSEEWIALPHPIVEFKFQNVS